MSNNIFLEKRTRSQNTKRNMVFGFGNKIITLFLPFISQTVLIRKLGIDYVGVNSLFSSILSVLCLAELGFGEASLSCLYRPLAKNDTDTVNGLLGLYKKVFFVIGMVIFGGGVIVLPFLDFLIKDEYPQGLNIKIVFAIFFIKSAISYMFFAYKKPLIDASQRRDVTSRINSVIKILSFSFRILSLIVFENFYLFILIDLIFVLCENVFIGYASKKMFPQYFCNKQLDEKEKNNVKEKVYGAFIGKLCGTTRNAFDSIFISKWLGLAICGIYSNYYFIMTSITGFLIVIISSVSSSAGDSIALESKKKNYEDMIKMNFAYLILAGGASICLLCLYQPFMKIWVGEQLMLPMSTVILFPIYFYIGRMGDVRGIYAEGAGLFWHDRKRCILETICNIVLNALLVCLWGVFGVLLATIITLFFIGFIGSTIVAFKHYFEEGKREYYKDQALLAIGTIIVGLITWVLCSLVKFGELENLIFDGIICILVIPLGYFLLFRKNMKFLNSFEWVKSKLIRRS